VAELHKLPRPVVRTRTDFHADGVGRQCCDHFHQLIAPDQRADEGSTVAFIDAVQGKHVLGQIDSDIHYGHGHLSSEGFSLKRRISIVAARASRRLESNHRLPTRVGDCRFIR
jgi:hypothetical protein